MEQHHLIRIAALIFAALAITIALVQMARSPEPAPKTTPPTIVSPTSDPLRQELRRCQQLGSDAVDDSGCLQVWAENRNRFLGRNQPR